MVQIKIERIGDDTSQQLGFYRKMTNKLIPGLGDMTFGKTPSSAWCAEITGLHPKFKFERKFLKGNRSYVNANRVGSRGVFDYFNLENGKLYEVSSPVSWKNIDRYFCRIENDELIRMDSDEVLKCLKNRSE